MPDFNGQQSYVWTFITSSEGISDFSPHQFLINTGGFVNPFTGYFSVVQQGNNLAIEYTAAVPEPSTYALLGIGAIGMLMVLRRKKKTA
ncbi:MAG: PEP-CTERM sorting domain-containing protein [Verrucomicrobia bacterium]|nr:PEP-CTERM sorting domain-containing protein [Verrucomicrobiota bacterium]